MNKLVLILLIPFFAFVGCGSTKIYRYCDEEIRNDNNVIYSSHKDFKQKKPTVKNYNIKITDDITKEYYCRTLTVKNKTDYKLIGYTFLAKPIIITGVAVGNIVKCAAMSLTTLGRTWWGVASGENVKYKGSPKYYFNLCFPDYHKVREKKERAKNITIIDYPEYEEYRRILSKSHIIDEKQTIYTTNYNLPNEEEKIINYEKHEYDNSINLSKNIYNDYISTVYITNYIGYMATAPIVCTSCICGYILGIHSHF